MTNNPLRRISKQIICLYIRMFFCSITAFFYVWGTDLVWFGYQSCVCQCFFGLFVLHVCSQTLKLQFYFTTASKWLAKLIMKS